MHNQIKAILVNENLEVMGETTVPADCLIILHNNIYFVAAHFALIPANSSAAIMFIETAVNTQHKLEKEYL